MTDAFARHLCLKQAKLFCLTLWPTGPVEIDKAIRNMRAYVTRSVWGPLPAGNGPASALGG